MKYAFIAGALGWTETPECTEGLFLQPEEAAKIDKDLQTGAASQKAAEDLVTANNTIEERNGTIAGLNTTISDMQSAANTAAQAAADTLAARDQRIQELEAQVTELGKGSSGKGTTVPSAEDVVASEKVSTSALPRYDSPDHPANKEADKYTRKKS